MASATDFIRAIINDDLECGKVSRIAVRFPPEPNGFLHIGHAKSSTLNFGLAAEYGGQCNLRFDDTNPATEDQKYVDAIKRDLRWLGFDWGDCEFYASDYFEQLYDWACKLIRLGLAYVDDSSEEEIRAMRGTVTQPGLESPFRQRPRAENLELFEQMRAGAFGDGERVLRARIDMAHPNMKMRDPLMYRIRHAHHYRRGDAWCIYPFYDWAHGQSDAIENITHSICTLEFTTNRVLYDWYLDALEIDPRPYQYEFARLNMDYTVTSKRKLLMLVRDGHVDSWSDPRMPTLAGLRRRGVTPNAIRAFCTSIGTTRVDSTYDPSQLEHAARQDLNDKAKRVMCVQDPVPVTLMNWTKGLVENLDAPYWPRDIPRDASRSVPISSEILIERSDFAETPPKGYRRLVPGRSVRLMHAYVIRCDHAEKDDSGQIIRLYCTVLRDSGEAKSVEQAPRARGTIHWVDAHRSKRVELRMYDRLFSEAAPSEDFLAELNNASLVVYPHARIEPSVFADDPETRYQFVRVGYFWRDPELKDQAAPVFNCIVPLRDSWGKVHATTTASRKPETPRTKEKEAPELSAKTQAWLAQTGLSPAVGAAIFAARGGTVFFANAAARADGTLVANWMANQLLPALDGRELTELPFTADDFASLVTLVTSGTASSHDAREVLAIMLESGGIPDTLLKQVQASRVANDDILKALVDEVLTAHADRVQAYHGGKTGLADFFVGQVMKKTRGRASPQRVQSLIRDALNRLT